MNVLVIGGSQFNGLALVHRLVRHGHAVTVLNRGRTDVVFPPDVRRLLGDRTDEGRIRELVGSDTFDCVFDMCAYHPSDIDLMISVFRGRVGHYVFISSIAIYAHSKVLPISEDFPVDRSDDQNEYGLHKILCEDILRRQHESTGFPATTVVLPMVMGPRNVIPDREQRMFVRLLTDRPILIPGDGTAVGQIGYVEDDAEALHEIMGQPITFGQRYNLTGPQWFSDEGYVDVFAEVTGREPRKVFIPTDLMDELWDGKIEVSSGRPSATHIDIRSSESARAATAMMQRWRLATLIQKAQPNLHRWNQNLVLSTEKIGRDLGWRPRSSFREAVERTFQWFQEQDMLSRSEFDFTFEDSIVDLVEAQGLNL
jgi:nucleoside-diphosphate-sugar epimerase